MDGLNMSTDIKTVYDKICQSHDGIADFRAKLLALLPLASGAGIFLLIGGKSPGDDVLPHLLPIGLFSTLVTVGLFFYELRGIQKCRGLIACARRLEKELLGESLWGYGTFKFRQKAALKGTVGAAGAALVIYPAVIGAWMYIASIGLVNPLTFEETRSVMWLPILSVLLALFFGLAMNRWQKNQLNQELEKIEQR